MICLVVGSEVNERDSQSLRIKAGERAYVMNEVLYCTCTIKDGRANEDRSVNSQGQRA